MRKLIVFSLLAAILVPAAHADEGVVTKKSANSVGVTLDCLAKELKGKGLTIFARVDHTKNAEGVGLSLRPTQLLIFGNPKLGTLLMDSNQLAGLDLPMKALAWQDAEGQVWLSYNAPTYIAGRHHITDQVEAVKKMTGALGKFTDHAAAPHPGGC
jgi:uncharacterized protein (DUF302 family)